MPAERPRLVLVTGAPGSGKTTLAELIGPALGLPVMSRDRLKVHLAEALGYPEPVAPSALARTNVALFFRLVPYLLASGPGLIVESALDVRLAPDDLAPALAVLRAAVIHCDVDPALNAVRVRERLRSGSRHRAHRDDRHLAAIAADPAAWDAYREPAPFGAAVLRVDTTDGYRPTLAAILRFARVATADDGPPTRR